MTGIRELIERFELSQGPVRLLRRRASEMNEFRAFETEAWQQTFDD
jgi:hypothetical protein